MFEAWAFVNAPLCRRAKEWGIKMGQEPGIPFEYDRVIDVWTANNIYLAHNQYGLWSQGWVSNVRIRNVRPQHKSPIAWVVAAPRVFAWADGWLFGAHRSSGISIRRA